MLVHLDCQRTVIDFQCWNVRKIKLEYTKPRWEDLWMKAFQKLWNRKKTARLRFNSHRRFDGWNSWQWFCPPVVRIPWKLFRSNSSSNDCKSLKWNLFLSLRNVINLLTLWRSWLELFYFPESIHKVWQSKTPNKLNFIYGSSYQISFSLK